jgi:hypothetical protein
MGETMSNTRQKSLTKTHSVAFRVNDTEWYILKRAAEREGTSVPVMTQEAIFEKLKLRSQLARTPKG